MFPEDSPYKLRIYPLWWIVALVLVVQGVMVLGIGGLIYPKAIRAETYWEEVGEEVLEPAQRDAARILLAMFILACILWCFILLVVKEPWVDIIEYLQDLPSSSGSP